MAGNTEFEVIIIGGSYAGLSAAMTLGRSLRKVLVIDSGKPCNATTPHSHNFLTQDGKPPAAIAAVGKQQVEQYKTVQFYNGLATQGIKNGNGFQIITQAGDTFKAPKLIFATGIADKLPAVKGLADCWGISVIHCPYCHGYEYRSMKTGILANGDAAFHYAQLVNNLTKDLVIFTNGSATFTSEQVEKLKKHSINIIETGIAGLEHKNGHISSVKLDDGSQISLSAMYARVPFVQHSDIPVSLGCELTEQGYIKVNELQKTTVPGIFACGDNSGAMRAVANAVATGNFSGAVVNKELTEEQF